MLLAAAEPAQGTCELICQFGHLEPTVQGATIAAGAALLATIATLVITALTTAAQLRHQKNEAKRARAFEVKKDVLLGLLDGMAGMRQGLNKLLEYDSPVTEAQAIFNGAAQLAGRAHATASIPIIANFMAVIEETSVSFLALLTERISLNSMAAAHDDSAQKLKLASDLETLTRAEMEFRQRSAELDAARTKFGQRVISVHFKLYPLVQEVTALIRVDLGIDAPVDSPKYIEASAVKMARVKERLGEVMEPGILFDETNSPPRAPPPSPMRGD